MYRPNFGMVMKILIRLLENDGENLAELVRRPTRLGRNLKTYLEHGADAELLTFVNCNKTSKKASLWLILSYS